MTFQFLCPQGHLLEADETQVGQQGNCPLCGSVFLIPQPFPAAPPDAPAGPSPGSPQAGFPTSPPHEPPGGAPPPAPAGAGPPAFAPPDAQTPDQPGPEGFPGIRTTPDVGRDRAAADAPTQFPTPSAAQLPVVHVICPNGHRLETPREMLGQEALCPFCQAQFRLRLEDSVEYRQEKAAEQERKEIRMGQTWLRWAIIIAVVVVLGLTMLIVLSAM